MVIVGGIVISALSSLIIIFGWGRHYRIAITLNIFQGLIMLFLFYHFFSDSALTQDGKNLKEFTFLIYPLEIQAANIEFFQTKDLPIQFLLKMNKKNINTKQLRQLSKEDKEQLIVIVPLKKLKMVEGILHKKLKILDESRYIYKLKGPIVLASNHDISNNTNKD